MPASRPIVRLTRTARFSAAHRYHVADWSEERNRAVFGPNVALHGHNYQVELSLRAPLDPATGLCVDLAALDRILEREVTGRLGMRDLTDGVEGLVGLSTTENLAVHLWRRLEPALRALGAGVALERIRVYESPDLFADFEGEERAEP